MASLHHPSQIPAGDSNRAAPPLHPAGPQAPAPDAPQSSDRPRAASAIGDDRRSIADHIADLPREQELALVAIMAGKSAVDAAREAGVNRSTIHRWRTSDPQFMAALNIARLQMKQAIADSLGRMAQEALEVIAGSLARKEFRAAATILKFVQSESVGPGDVRAIKRELNLRLRKSRVQKTAIETCERMASKPLIYEKLSAGVTTLLGNLATNSEKPRRP